jgi:hypothetical protein
MRKISLSIVFLLLSAITKAQKPVLFKFKYLPAHTYGIITKDGMNAKIAVQDLTANAGKRADTTTTTINMVVNTEWGTTVKTDAAAAGSFPVTILGNQFSMKTTLNGTDAPVAPELNLLQGLAVKGKMDPEGKMVLDTAAVENKVKLVVGMLTAGMPKQLIFPDKPMIIGDTFSREDNLTGMNMPDFGFDMDYPTKVTYKLTAVKDNLAYFDMTSEFKMSVDKEAQGKTVHVNGKGMGTGKMEFYIDKGYPKSTVNNVDYLLEFTGPNAKVDMKWNKSTDAKYDVSNN